MNESDKTTASTVKEVKREFSGCALAGKGTLVRGLYDKALDLAKRLDATLATVSIVRGEGTPSDRDCLDEIVSLQQRAESAEAALKRKDGLLRWLLQYFSTSEEAYQRIQHELDGKGE